MEKEILENIDKLKDLRKGLINEFMTKMSQISEEIDNLYLMIESPNED